MAFIPGRSGEGAARGRGLVLVAEDDVKMREALSRFLSLQGYEVIEAADGREAVSLARGRAPDIVLLDIAMPGKNGLEVLKELVPEMPATGFIMVTGNEDEELARSCLRLGAFDYVPKPVDMEVLAHSIRARFLARPQLFEGRRA